MASNLEAMASSDLEPNSNGLQPTSASQPKAHGPLLQVILCQSLRHSKPQQPGNPSSLHRVARVDPSAEAHSGDLVVHRSNKHRPEGIRPNVHRGDQPPCPPEVVDGFFVFRVGGHVTHCLFGDLSQFMGFIRMLVQVGVPIKHLEAGSGGHVLPNHSGLVSDSNRQVKTKPFTFVLRIRRDPLRIVKVKIDAEGAERFLKTVDDFVLSTVGLEGDQPGGLGWQACPNGCEELHPVLCVIRETVSYLFVKHPSCRFSAKAEYATGIYIPIHL